MTRIWKYRFYYYLAIPGLLYFLIFHYVPMGGALIAFKDISPFDGLGGFFGAHLMKSGANITFLVREKRKDELKNILEKTNKSSVDIIVISPYDPTEGALWLSEKTQIPVVTLPYTIGGNEESNNLIALFDSSIKILHNALYDK